MTVNMAWSPQSIKLNGRRYEGLGYIPTWSAGELATAPPQESLDKIERLKLELLDRLLPTKDPERCKLAPRVSFAIFRRLFLMPAKATRKAMQ